MESHCAKGARRAEGVELPHMIHDCTRWCVSCMVCVCVEGAGLLHIIQDCVCAVCVCLRTHKECRWQSLCWLSEPGEKSRELFN